MFGNDDTIGDEPGLFTVARPNGVMNPSAIMNPSAAILASMDPSVGGKGGYVADSGPFVMPDMSAGDPLNAFTRKFRQGPLNALLQWPRRGFLQGAQLEEGFERARKEGQTQREDEALRDASASMGQGDYFTGYEGVPGATRPDYIKRLFARGNPQVALKMEQALATPYAQQREIQKAGGIEKAKREANQELWLRMVQKLGFMPRPQSPH